MKALKIILLPVALICFLLALLINGLGGIAKWILRIITSFIAILTFAQFYYFFKNGSSELMGVLFMSTATIAVSLATYFVDAVPEFLYGIVEKIKAIS